MTRIHPHRHLSLFAQPIFKKAYKDSTERKLLGWKITLYWSYKDINFTIYETRVGNKWKIVTALYNGKILKISKPRPTCGNLGVILKYLKNEIDQPKKTEFDKFLATIYVSIYNYSPIVHDIALSLLIDKLVEFFQSFPNLTLDTENSMLIPVSPSSSPEAKVPKNLEKNKTYYSPAVIKTTTTPTKRLRIVPVFTERSPFYSIAKSLRLGTLLKNLKPSKPKSLKALQDYLINPNSLHNTITLIVQEYNNIKETLAAKNTVYAQAFLDPHQATRTELSIAFMENHPVRNRKYSRPLIKPTHWFTAEEISLYLQLTSRLFFTQPYARNVFSYDINALYPFIYTFPIPKRLEVWNSHNLTVIPPFGEIPYVRVLIHYIDPHHPLRFPDDSNTTNQLAILTLEEYHILLNEPGIKIEFLSIYTSEKLKLFSLQEIVLLKDEISKIRDKPFALFIKDKLNLWWGRISFKARPLYLPLIEDGTVMKTSKTSMANPKAFFGMHVTSWARLYMLIFLLSPKYKDHILYHDTDSMITTAPLTEDWPNQQIFKLLPPQHQEYLQQEVKAAQGWIHPTRLGLFKEEPFADEALFLKNKVYIKRTGQIVALTAAGLPHEFKDHIRETGNLIKLFNLLKELTYWACVLQKPLTLTIQSDRFNPPHDKFSFNVNYHPTNSPGYNETLHHLTPQISHFKSTPTSIKLSWPPKFPLNTPNSSTEALWEDLAQDGLTLDISKNTLSRGAFFAPYDIDKGDSLFNSPYE